MFDLKVGYSCNNRCIHCVVENKKICRDLRTEEIVSLVQQYSNEDIVFTGGEATIRPDFLYLLQETRRANPDRKIFLQTNGRAFSDPEFTKRVLPYIDNALIAVHSHNQIIHDMITQKDGSFSETIRGIANIYNIDPQKITTQTVISKINYFNLSKTYEYIQTHFPNVQRMNLTYPHYNGGAWDNSRSVAVSYSDIRSEINKTVLKYNKKIIIESIPRCVLFPYHDIVNIPSIPANKKGIDIANANGKFFGENGIGNYKEAIADEHIKLETCSMCALNGQCEGVWKEYGMLFKDRIRAELKPIVRG